MKKVRVAKKYTCVCIECTTTFISTRRTSKYCSKVCYRKAEYRKSSLDYTWRLRKLLAMAKNRANEKGLPFDIDAEYLLDLWEDNLGCCAITGVLFDLEPWGELGQVSPNAPSIDRIIPKNGYIKGNIRLVTYHVNIAMSDFGYSELEKLSKLIVGGSV